MRHDADNDLAAPRPRPVLSLRELGLVGAADPKTKAKRKAAKAARKRNRKRRK